MTSGDAGRGCPPTAGGRHANPCSKRGQVPPLQPIDQHVEKRDGDLGSDSSRAALCVFLMAHPARRPTSSGGPVKPEEGRGIKATII